MSRTASQATSSASRAKERRLKERRLTAIHEAAHGVVALWYGHGLEPHRAITVRGKFVGGTAFGYAYMKGRCYVVWSDHCASEQGAAHIALAGPLAAARAGESYVYAHDQHALKELEAVERSWPDTSALPSTDMVKCACGILSNRGALLASELLPLVRRYEETTNDLLNKPEVWNSIERLASELMTTWTLNAPDALSCIVPSVMHGHMKCS